MKLIGMARLGRDAELRSTSSGDYVAQLSLAFNYGRKGSDGNRPSQWVRASLWGKRAEALHEYLLKGTTVVVTLGDPHIETFQKQDGTEATSMVATVDDIEIASRPSQDRQPAQQRPAAQAPRQPQRQQPAQTSRGEFDNMDDDIPF